MKQFIKEALDETIKSIKKDISTIWNLRMVFVILLVFILCAYAINKLE